MVVALIGLALTAASPETQPAPAAALEAAAATPDADPAQPEASSQPTAASQPSSPPTSAPNQGWGDIEFEVFKLEELPAEETCAPPPPGAAEATPLRSPCPARRTARWMTWGGFSAAALGALSALGLTAVALYQRAEAERLLLESPAFADKGDQIVISQPGNPDVASYQSLRASASVLGQLAWIALGVTGAGAAFASAALLLERAGEPCTVAARPAAVEAP